MPHSHTYKATVEKKPHSIAEISVEVPAASLDEHRPIAVKSLAKAVAVDGFRKGHVPEKVLIERLGDMAILTEAADIVIRHTYPHILEDEKLDPIGQPEVEIMKLAADNPLIFKIRVALMPDITLPDYKKIAKGVNVSKESAEVTDKEVDEAIENLLRQKAAYERLQEKQKAKKEADEDTIPTTHTHEDGTVHEGPDHDEVEEKLPLPELTDEYAKTLGNFQSVADLKTQLKMHLTSEKQREIAAKHRAKITDAIVEETKTDLPRIIIDAEVRQMFAEMESDLTRANLKLDDYLAHIKKTREDLEKEWAPAAEKRAKLQLILNEIAKKEDTKADAEKVEAEVKHLLTQFKDAKADRVRTYVESVLRNEKILEMLETQN